MKFKIHFLFFVFWAIFIILADTDFILCIFIAAAFHEAAHICAYTAFGAELDSVQLLPFGISATLKNAVALPCRKEIICAAAGPLANIILTAAYFIPENIVYGSNVLAYCSFALFLINILPVMPLDGGRILWFTMLSVFPYKKAKKITDTVSIITAATVLLAGTVTAAENGNISLLMIGSYLVIHLVFKS